MRIAAPGGATGIILGLELAALIVAIVFTGLDLWVAFGFVAIAWWVLAQFKTPAGASIAANGFLGLAFSEQLVGQPPAWVSAVFGMVACAMVALGYARGGNPESTTGGNGDPNLIPFIVAIIGTRAFLALKYTSVLALDANTSYLDWAAVYLVGAIPSAPILVNVVMVVGFQGTLAVGTAILIKRILFSV